VADAPLYLYDDPHAYLDDEDAPTRERQHPSTRQAQEPDSLPPVLTIDEAARLLRVNRKTLYELASKGRLPGTRRVGRIIRVDRDELLAWMKGQSSVLDSPSKGRVVSSGRKHGGTTR
jgi:excisionase family DNA binding protein